MTPKAKRKKAQPHGFARVKPGTTEDASELADLLTTRTGVRHYIGDAMRIAVRRVLEMERAEAQRGAA